MSVLGNLDQLLPITSQATMSTPTEETGLAWLQVLLTQTLPPAMPNALSSLLFSLLLGREKGEVKKPKNSSLSTMLCYAKSLQSCPTLCDPIDSSPPGSPVPGILQARTLEWVAISFSTTWKWKVKLKLLSRVRLSATPWTAAYQAPPSMGFSRQEYWSGCHCLLPLSTKPFAEPEYHPHYGEPHYHPTVPARAHQFMTTFGCLLGHKLAMFVTDQY